MNLLPYRAMSARKSRWRWTAAMCSALIDRGLARLPLGPWLQRFSQRRLEFRELDLILRRGGAGLDEKRIAFLSDLHAGASSSEADLCRVFAAVSRLEPDLVCLGGDLVNTKPGELELLRAPLRLLSAPVVAVPGNHDRFWCRDHAAWEGFLEDCGVDVLVNRGRRMVLDGSSLWLAGVDDMSEGQPDLAAALQGRAPGEPALLLAHQPDFFDEAARADVDLTLSGHTHGGQIRILGWSPLVHSRFGFLHGHYQRGSAQLYVGRGVGTTLLPLRLGAPPEIPIFRLQVHEPARSRARAQAES